MCIRDRIITALVTGDFSIAYVSDVSSRGMPTYLKVTALWGCLLYTSDAADERSSVDLGGRRIIKKKNNVETVR